MVVGPTSRWSRPSSSASLPIDVETCSAQASAAFFWERKGEDMLVATGECFPSCCRVQLGARVPRAIGSDAHYLNGFPVVRQASSWDADNGRCNQATSNERSNGKEVTNGSRVVSVVHVHEGVGFTQWDKRGAQPTYDCGTRKFDLSRRANCETHVRGKMTYCVVRSEQCGFAHAPSGDAVLYKLDEAHRALAEIRQKMLGGRVRGVKLLSEQKRRALISEERGLVD